MTSPDGISWTSRTIPSSYWSSVAYGNGIFVASGGDGTAISSDGINWNMYSFFSQAGTIVFGNGTFVIVVQNQTYVSVDGINWTATSYIKGYGLSFVNGIFIQANGSNLFTSPDGINWTPSTPGTVGPYVSNFAYGNGIFVGVKTFNFTRAAFVRSTDGKNWSTRLSNLISLVYGNSMWVACSDIDAQPFRTLYYSKNGRDWFFSNSPPTTWSSVTYGNGYFMAVSNNGTYPVAYSQDGINWSTVTTGFQATDWKSVSFGQNTFMALEATGASTMITQLGETFQ